MGQNMAFILKYAIILAIGDLFLTVQQFWPPISINYCCAGSKHIIIAVII